MSTHEHFIDSAGPSIECCNKPIQRRRAGDNLYATFPRVPDFPHHAMHDSTTHHERPEAHALYAPTNNNAPTLHYEDPR